MKRPGRYPSRVLSVVCLLIVTRPCMAAGLVSEFPVVFLNAADGEAYFHVVNTDPEETLLYTSLQDLSQEDGDTLTVTPPVVRVAPGEKQRVRVTLQPGIPITTQQLKHLGVERRPQGPGSDLSRREVQWQDLPVLISPGDLPEKSDPWTLLEWSVEGQQLVVRNDSRYVVRLNQQVNVVAANTNLMLPNAYILPGQMHRLELPRGSDLGSTPSVRIYPASICGSAEPYDAVLERR